MKSSVIFRLSAFFILMAGYHSLQAQYTGSTPTGATFVTTAVPFLRISPDARAGGMGDLGVATSPDANSALYNNAKSPFAKHDIGIGLTYTPWLKDLGLNDVYLLAASGFYKLNDKQALTSSIRYFSLGNIQFTDASGNALNTGQPREWSFDLGYSQKLADKLSLGLALRYIHSNLAASAPNSGGAIYKAGTSVAGDINLFYTNTKENGQGYNLGATITNLGTKIGYTNDATQKDYIPANLSIGGTYTAAFDEQNKLTFGIDLHKLLVPQIPIDSSGYTSSTALTDYRSKSVVSSWFNSFSGPGQLSLVNLSVGAEYAYQDQFFVRAGYYYEDKSQGDRKFFTVGLGVKYNIIGLNFSYLVPSGNGVTRNPLSNTLRFGLVFDLDNNKNSTGSPAAQQ